MDTTGRLLRLLSLLQARPAWTGGDLADRLGVTPRTLRRDMTRLRELGYPVEATTGPHGGYRLVAGGALPPLLLDDDEAVAVALGLRSAAAGALPGFEDPAVAALAKIEQVLPRRLQDRIDDLAAVTVRVGGGAPGERRIEVATLVAVAQACRGLERMRFVYRDGSDQRTERHVEPYQLVHTARRWYLMAWDRDREAWRSFRVDRMTEARSTGMRFTRREYPDPAAFVAEGLAVGAYSQQARVVLRAPHEEAVRFISPTVGVLEASGDHTLLRIGADDLGWIARYLAGLGVRFEVVEPEELREEVALLAARLTEDSQEPPERKRDGTPSEPY